jgi:hypothetical protein
MTGFRGQLYFKVLGWKNIGAVPEQVFGRYIPNSRNCRKSRSRDIPMGIILSTALVARRVPAEPL